MALTYRRAEELFATARYPEQGKPLAGNTRLHMAGDTTYRVTLYGSTIVRIYPDNTYQLYAGGWPSQLTQSRLNEFAPARIYSGRVRGDIHSQWYIWHPSDLVTDPKPVKCRGCHGTGKVWPRTAYEGAYSCSYCNGTGVTDAGSHQVPHLFEDGIQVDETGAVIDTDGRSYLARYALMSHPYKRLPRPRGGSGRKGAW